ncbi:MAG: hypothetical protein ACOY4R_27760 [Pseudomonadota bacterium]
MRRLEVEAPQPEYPDADARCTTLETKNKTCILVTLGEHIDGRDHTGIVALIVHEATHVWQAIRRNIGEEDPSAEFEAYAMQNIVLGLLAAYEKTRGQS